MHPTKLKNLLAPVAAEFNLPESTVSALATSYFKQVQGYLSSPVQLAVDVPGLGLFSIKPKALDRKVLRIKANVERLESHTSKRSRHILANYQQELSQLLHLQELLAQETERRSSKRALRYGSAATI